VSAALSLPQPEPSDPFLELALPIPEHVKDQPRNHHDMLDNARLAVEHDPGRYQAERYASETERRVLCALRLAPSLEAFEALLRGDDVPRSKLDPEWLRAYNL
jgi:hypothetical protein